MGICKRKKSIIIFFYDFIKNEHRYFKHYKRNIYIKKPICKEKNFQYYMFVYFVLISKMIIENKSRKDIEQYLINFHIQKGWKDYIFLILFYDDEFISKIAQYLEKRIEICDNKVFTNVRTLISNEINNYF